MTTPSQDDRRPAAVWPGRHEPLGATWSEESTNFAVFAPEATGVELCLFDDGAARGRDASRADRADAGHLARRAARASRPASATASAPTGRGSRRSGLRFNPAKLLLDPYARAVSGDGRPRTRRSSGYDASDARRDRARRRATPRRTCRAASSSTTTSTGASDRPIGAAGATPSIYELHVKGFTPLHDRVPEELRGTYAGLAHPRGHRLPQRPRRHRGRAAAGAPVRLRAGARRARADATTGATTRSASSPRTRRTAPAGDRGQQVTEFKAMVKALPRGRARGDPRRRLQPHRRGRPARADAVASAGSTTSATTSGSRRPGSTRRAPDTYWDVTGCGNTVDAAHPPALRLILDSLRYWVTEMHVDGFRFDLMSALTRTGHAGRHGGPPAHHDRRRTRCCATSS